MLYITNIACYYYLMIETFKCKETKKIFKQEWSRKLPRDIQRPAMKKLWMIHAAPELDTLTVPPSNKLEKLKGDRKQQHSIRINKQWRICFIWRGNHAYDVEIVDYH